eukprot:TRINITY_DN44560_c0_g1_i2.p2 TRINITY_DN44560_c0_g1~~TRINITY_DN44560_c0_g1_i2.p2  ORF type:complete len:264 (+),score=63.91 TRINITY_DN44560_c0_g1_i2:69-860(+)
MEESFFSSQSGRQLRFPVPLCADDELLSAAFREVAAAKAPGDALAWWEHAATGKCAASAHFKVLSRKLLAGQLPGASLDDEKQACGQSGSVVMCLEFEVSSSPEKKRILELIVKTATEYPSPDCDFYLQDGLYSAVPEIFLEVFAVEGDPGKGFTIVMEKFGDSFPGKPGMRGYDSQQMLQSHLPAAVGTLAAFHAAFWNDTRLVPQYMMDGAGHHDEQAFECQDSFAAFLERRFSWLKNPSHLDADGLDWLFRYHSNRPCRC